MYEKAKNNSHLDSDMAGDTEKDAWEHKDNASIAPNLKMRDGIILMPQPSDDPTDPLNWSWLRKHAAMFTISYLALICYVAVTTLVTGTVPVAKSLGVSKSTAVYLGNTPVALYGVAPWLWSPLSHFLGRRPVLLACNAIAMVGAVVVTTSQTYAACIVGRVILGAGGSAFWTLGPASIGDMFFRHEKGKKIGISTLAIVVSPFLGTIIGGPIIEDPNLGWRASQWIPLVCMGAGFIMQIFFLPETIYIREAASASTTMTETKKPTLWDSYGIHIPKRRGEHKHSFLFIATRPIILCKYPAVMLSAFWFGIAYMMHVGITAVIPLVFEADYNFSVLDVGLTGFSGLIGALVGEVYAGPALDFIVKNIAKQDREWQPEYRLQAIWPALVTVPGGLIMFGASLQFGNAWITPLVGQAVYIFGIEVATTVVYGQHLIPQLLEPNTLMMSTGSQTYILESYPRQGAEANLVFNLIRNIFSYTAPFFVQPMIAKVGMTSTFGLFAALTVFFFPFTIGILMWRGKEIRDKGGDPGWSRG